MKLIGIAAMLIDHFNAFVNPHYNQTLFEIGRIALPLFALVLGYNLARIPLNKIPKIMFRLFDVRQPDPRVRRFEFAE